MCDVHLLFDVAKTKQKKNWDSLEPERERERETIKQLPMEIETTKGRRQLSVVHFYH